MSNYFWREDALTPEQKVRLKRAKIKFSEHTKSSRFGFRSENGYLFDKGAHLLALKLLGAKISRERAEGGNLQPISVEVVFEGIPEHHASICCWSHEEEIREPFLEIAERILPTALGRDVIIHDTDGSPDPPLQDMDAIELHLFSSPAVDTRPNLKAPELVWEIPLYEQERAFAPSGLGRVIYDSEGVSVGEIVGHHVYLFFEVTHDSDEASLLIFESFCQAVLKSMKKGGLDPHEIRDSVYLERRESYAERCLGRIAHEVEARRSRLAEVERELLEHQARLLALHAEECCLRTEIPLITAHNADALERYREEYDKLCANPKIRSVFISNNFLIAHTQVLYWRHPKEDTYYEIGAMEITICLMEKSECVLRFKNLTRLVDGQSQNMHHPHVCNSGEPCWGGGPTRNTFITLVGRRELAAAVSFAVQFAETVNYTESWGRYYPNWPIVAPADIPRLRGLGLIPEPATISRKELRT